MSTEIVPFNEIERMAQAIAKSGLFGIKTADQCMALMLIAQAQGQHPAIVARDYDIIQGRPAKKTEAMLRDFLDAGGKVEWHHMTDVLAEATFSHPQGGSAKIDWTIDRAKKAGLSGKDTWLKFPRAMLANRVISEGCRRIYPASTSGLYEPGEVRDMAADTAEKAPRARAEPKDMGTIDAETGEILPAGTSTAEAGNSVSTGSGAVTSPTATSAGAGFVTRTDLLTDLCKQAGANLIDKLAVAKVAHADELTDVDYEELKASLRKRIERRKAA